MKIVFLIAVGGFIAACVYGNYTVRSKVERMTVGIEAFDRHTDEWRAAVERGDLAAAELIIKKQELDIKAEQ